MRTLTPAAQTAIDTQYGTEANVEIKIYWPNQNATEYGPDRILQVGDIDSVVASNGQSSHSISITLDDTDASVKSKIDQFETHSVKAEIYQQITGLAVPYLLFAGVITTPIVWSEGERTVSFNVMSRLKDKDAGYTDVDSQFWPLCFGSPQYVPATKIKKSIECELDDVLCIPDYSLKWKQSQLQAAYDDQKMIANFYHQVISGVNSIAPRVTTLINTYCDILRGRTALFNELAQIKIDIEKQQKIIRDVQNGVGGNNVRAIRARNDIQDLKKRFQQITGSVIDKEAEAQAKADAKAALVLGKAVPQVGPGLLNVLGWMKLECERLIQLAIERYWIKKDAFKRIVHCYTMMQTYVNQSKQYDIEQCKQEICHKSRVKIKQDVNHPVVTGRINIGGVLWHGTVDGDYLDLTGPFALYKDVPLATWHQPVEECEYLGWDKFWLTDATKRLSGMYCLVKSKRDSTKHVIKINTQDGTECTFDLVAFEASKSQHLVQTLYPSTSYNIALGPTPGVNIFIPGVHNSPQITLDNRITQRLNGALVGPEEFYALATLQHIEPQDYTNDQMLITFPGPTDIYTIVGWEIDEILEVAAIPLESWFDGTIQNVEIPSNLFLQIAQGSKIYQENAFYEIYVANTLPSTIKSIKAYYNNPITKVKSLTEVPSIYYSKNENENLGPFAVTSIRFNTPLNMIGAGQWDDKLYVSLVSSVGPNVVDVLAYLITNYTEKTFDTVSFGAVEISQENYPVDFAILKATNIYTLLNEIAWQARCAVYESNDVYYIKYLSIQGTPVATLTESDIEVSTLELTCEDTENVITKLVALWKPDYLDTTEQQYLTLQFNTALFGVNEQRNDFYIYKHESLVQKSATFWLIRLANVWKMVTCNTFLTHSDLEYLDIITLDLESATFANTDVNAEIREVNYDSVSKTIKLKLWLPVRFGEMTQYPLAWPALVDENTLFPTTIDLDKKYVPDVVAIAEVQGL